jgi:hypothetical protein
MAGSGGAMAGEVVKYREKYKLQLTEALRSETNDEVTRSSRTERRFAQLE